MGWTLADIREKVRKITGRLDTGSMSNAELDKYINDYYQFTFPAEIKLDTNQTYYEFSTVEGQQIYPFPSGFTNVQPPIWVNGDQIPYFTNPQVFFWAIPEFYFKKTLGVGNGILTAFSQAAQNYAIIAGSVSVTDGVETFIDDGNGILTGNQGGIGTADYTDGSVAVNFNTAPLNGTNVYVTYIQYQAGEPQAVLSFNNELRFYPIPDTIYQVKMLGYEVPAALTSSSSTPKLEEWGPSIAYGAARDIFSDNGEIDRYAEITALYKEQIRYILRRTLQDSAFDRVIRQN